MAENHKAALLEAYRAGRQVRTAAVRRIRMTDYQGSLRHTKLLL